jgi:TP901 family phage tail tape measure protein
MADRTVVVRLKAVVTDFQRNVAGAGASVNKLQDDIAKGAAANKAGMEKVSRGAMLLGGAAVAGFAVAVNAAAKFDKAMSEVSAVSGATTAQMGKLRQAALDAGAATVFSASEAATAQAELAKAGVSVTDILNGGLNGALSLAAAGTLELADAATIAAQAMNIFKLEGGDVGHIADVLAAGANKSAADVKQLGDALRQGGLVGAQMGADLESTVGTLSAFADNALIGSDAGTSFKTMMQRLVPTTVKAQSAMEQIGFSAFDANGEFVGLAGVAGQLERGLGKMSTQQRAATMNTIFGSDAVRAANVLYEQGEAGIRDYTSAVDDNGAAARMAAEKLNNLAGDVEALKGSLETALIQGGSGATGTLRELTQAATGAVNVFNDMPKSVQGGVTALLGIGGGITLALGALGTIAPKVAEARDTLRGLGAAGQFADRSLGHLGRLAGYGAIAATAAVGFKVLTDQIYELTNNGPANIDQLTNSLLNLREAKGTFEATGEAARLFGDDLSGVNVAVRDATKPLADLQSGFGLLPSRVDAARDKLSAIDDVLAGLVRSGNGAAAADLFLKLSANLPRNKVDDFRNSLDGYAGALAGVDTEAMLAEDSTDDFGAAVEGVVPVIEEAEDATNQFRDALDSLNGINIDAMRSQMDLESAFKDAAEAIEKGSTITDDETSALLDLAEQANETAKSMLDQGKSTDVVSDKMRTSRKRFMETAIEMGYTREEAERLRDKILQIPTARQLKFQTRGAGAAVDSVNAIRDAILALPSNVSVAVATNTQNRIGANPAIDGRRASGGGVRSGASYLVGENGPEVLTMAGNGYVTPGVFSRGVFTPASGHPTTSSTKGGSGGMSVTQYVTAPDPRTAANESAGALRRSAWLHGWASV